MYSPKRNIFIERFYFRLPVRMSEAGILAPIAEEILCQSHRVGKDWNGKRGAHF